MRSKPNPVAPSVARWRAQALVKEFMTQLRKALEVAVAEQPSIDAIEPDWRRDAQAAGFPQQDIEDGWRWVSRFVSATTEQRANQGTMPENVRRILTYNALYFVDYAPALLKELGLAVTKSSGSLEDDWRRDAQAAGLTEEEIDGSWIWFHRNAFEAPPVLEEKEQQTVRLTMPESVRRVLADYPLYWFVGYDHDLLDDSQQPRANVSQEAAGDRQYWGDIGEAFSDPRNRDTREALERIARLVRLKREHIRALAARSRRTMAAVKRDLIQQAVLLSLGAAKDPVRIGRRATQDDPGHPIKLDEVFGPKGAREVLAEMKRELGEDGRERLERSLGGPFRPAYLADDTIYQNWLTGEIQRLTVELLGQDLDIREAGRVGGSRRHEVSYDETEPEPGDEHEHQQRASRTTDYYEKKDRMELDLAYKIQFAVLLESIRRDHTAPVLREYIDRVLSEPLLLDDHEAAAGELGWTEGKVRDVKRRLMGYIAQMVAARSWNAKQINSL